MRSLARLLVALGVMVSVGYVLWALWRDPSLAILSSNLLVGPLMLALLIRMASSFESALVWLWIFRSVGGRLGFRDASRIYLVTAVAKYVPGKVMPVAGRVAMLREQGQPMAPALTSTVLELAFSLMAAAVVCVVCVPVLLWDHGLAEYGVWASWVAVVVLAAGLTALHPGVLGPVFRFGAGLLPRRLAGVSFEPLPYRTTLLVLTANVLSRMVGMFAFFLAIRSVYPLDPAWLPLLAGASAAGYLFGVAVPFAPGGLGAREGLVALILATMMPPPVAAIVSVLDRAVAVVAELVAAGLALLLARTERPLVSREAVAELRTAGAATQPPPPPIP